MPRRGQLWPFGAESRVVHPEDAPGDGQGLIYHAASGLWLPSAVALTTDPRFPSSGEKSALGGTSGTPGSGNKFVTNADARNTDARVPIDGSVTLAKLASAALAGVVAGASPFVWSSNTANSDPGSGKIKSNSANPLAAATPTFRMSATDALGRAAMAWAGVKTTLTGSIRFNMLIFKRSDPSTYGLFYGFAPSSTVGWTSFTAALANGAGSFADGDEVIVTVIPVGEVGAATSNLVTALPGSPTNGEHVTIDPSAWTVAGTAENRADVEWELRYNSTTGKWHCVGGPPLIVSVAAGESTAGTSYTDLTTVGPGFTPAIAGEYVIQAGYTYGQLAAAAGYMSYSINAGAAGTAADADAALAQIGAGGVANLGAVGPFRRKSLTAGNATTARYKAGAGLAIFANRWLAVRPVRLG